MSPKEARVFVIEDDKFYQDKIRRVLEEAGHAVVLTSGELFDALRKIRGGEVDKLGVQVVTIDGKLTNVGGEGQLLAEDIRRKNKRDTQKKTKIKTVGLSNSGEVAGVDINVFKSEIDRLGEIINSL